MITKGVDKSSKADAALCGGQHHRRYRFGDDQVLHHHRHQPKGEDGHCRLAGHPGIALDDPLLMMGMPPALTAATGMDALTHAVEAYVSTIATPMTDSAAEKAIELIATHLRPAVANGSDIVAREGMCYAQYLAGMAFNNASLGHVHAMAHQLGGFYDLPHGECNAILLPHVCKFNLIAKMERFVKIAKLMGENVDGLSPRDAAELALKAIQKLSTDIGIPAGSD
jgi:alcohol dehydrogenase